MSDNSPAIEILKHLTAISVELSAEKDHDRLLESILLKAKELTNADGGTLYLRTEDDRLEFSIMRNDQLGLALGGTTGKKPALPPIALYKPDGVPNFGVQVVFAVLKNKPINIDDVYNADGFDFAGTRVFDEKNNYKTTSVITIPMQDHTGRVIGALQLINAKNSQNETISFSNEVVNITMALASLAAVALSNKTLIEQQKELLEAFIKVIAQAIDAKSPYTGRHCTAVPVIADMLAAAATRANDGFFKDFHMSEEELYELHIAGWLHDCGKVVTPVHVMDKATKLETIFDRIHLVTARIEIIKRDVEIAMLKGHMSQSDFEASIKALDDDLGFLRIANVGGEFMSDDKIDRLNTIAAKSYSLCGNNKPLLTDEELYNLSIRRGTLTSEERKIMEGHMVMTMKMLESLPFPRHLRRVPEYAIGHHEKMDGTGYPRGIAAGSMSIPARMMAIADVFEALTSVDRPYKKPKTLSESLKIMGFMKRDHHLDPDIFDFFVQSGVYREFAIKNLAPEQIDEVNEAELLAIKPNPAK